MDLAEPEGGLKELGLINSNSLPGEVCTVSEPRVTCVAPAISHLRLCADLYTQYSTYVRRLVQTWTSEFRDPTNYSPDYHPWSAWAVQPGGLSALSSQTKAEPEAEGGR